MTEKVQKERWPRQDYLSANAILNYWFDGDEDKIRLHKHALRDACVVGYVGCVANCNEDESVGTLFDRGGKDLLIERKSFEEWVAGSERIVRDAEKPAHWFDQIFIDNARKDREREEQRVAEEARLAEEMKMKEQAKLEDQIRLETEIKLRAELEFKEKNKNKKQVETGPVSRRKFNNYVYLVGALYETFIKREYDGNMPRYLEELISHIESHYPKVDGLSRRTLTGKDSKFKYAVRELKSQIVKK